MFFEHPPSEVWFWSYGLLKIKESYIACLPHLYCVSILTPNVTEACIPSLRQASLNAVFGDFPQSSELNVSIAT